MADMTEGCVFEHVAPAAVSFGGHPGQDAVRAVWESMDTHFPGYTQEVVDIFAAGDRCTRGAGHDEACRDASVGQSTSNSRFERDENARDLRASLRDMATTPPAFDPVPWIVRPSPRAPNPRTM